LDITGSGAAGRLTVFNRSQWAGDFLSAGVAAVDMDLLNMGTSLLSIRIGMKASPAMGAAGFASTVGFTLPADGAWHHATFLLDSVDLTRINSTTLTLNDLLSNVAEFRILHSIAPALNGTPITSQLGIDNIRALGAVTAIPEPNTFFLLGSGVVAFGIIARRRNPI
jgi:hypothetical protein